jgi:hypothetical protein
VTSKTAAAVRVSYEHPALADARHARQMFADLMSLAPEHRRKTIKALSLRDYGAVIAAAHKEGGTPFALWQDDPVGFVEKVLDETTWSKQREALAAVGENKRVAVPSAYDVGKTHIAARATLWRSLVYPPGTSLTVTTATRFRQVQRQLWPHIRQVVARCGLPLKADMTQLKAITKDGAEVVVAYGFSAPPHDEAAVQGIHFPRLFIVVDEAGGISRVIGQAMRGLLTGSDSRMLAIGNPPTDDEGSWFEQFCLDDDTVTIPISAMSAPAVAGELSPVCLTCPAEVPEHSIGTHLVDRDWVESAIEDYGEDAPYVQAKVYARFPKGGSNRALHSSWVDAAYDLPEPDDEDGHVRLADLELEGEDDPWLVKLGAWIRLGVDVAADGGDEFVIARTIGDLATVRHSSSGAANANPTDVAGVALAEIKRAERLRAALGTAAKVRVKVDAIGVGWAVAGILEAWGTEGLHDAEIVRVIVSEGTGRPDDESATFRPYRKRDEMWLALRALLTPRKREPARIRLRIDQRTRAQLSSPTYGTGSHGRTVIESKPSMRARGLSSPDRAEAILLGFYEPAVKKKRGLLA